MSIITIETIEEVKELNPNLTNQDTGPAGRLISYLKENIGNHLSCLTTRIKESNSRRYVFDMYQALRNHYFRLKELGRKADSTWLEVAEAVKNYAVTLPSVEEDLKLMPLSYKKDFINGATGAEKAFRALACNGIKPSDTPYIVDLQGLRRGEIVVKGSSSRARIITSENQFDLDDEVITELIKVLEKILIREDGKGTDVKNQLGPFTQNWDYTPSQVIASHAEWLADAGVSAQEIADLHGIRRKSLVSRQKKYRRAN